MTSAEIRQQFIDFFVQRHGHTFVPSSPVVPHDDPTLLFTNAGMNQFKPIFLGTEKRAYTRAANTQKCIRAGGKHNDLDDVGRSRRHHTFFEMLGNWSFGDYFKRDAIAWSWELLTKVWKLDPTMLHVTVHAGDAAIGVERDNEAAQIWREVANWEQYGRKSDDHIHYGNTKDNFWEMGETGPCGPCTEIFVDRTPDRTGGPTVLTGEDPRVMEIWNNVFIQYNRNPDRSLTPLPAQHVDTGMGLERIIQVLQGVDDNYAIDLFEPFWAKLTELSGIKYAGKYPKSNEADPVAEAADPQLRTDIAFRVIADHIRCLTFALTDGAVVSNEGRGYVLRRILRRAVRFGRQQLELREPFLHTLVPVVVEAMGGAFPELKRETQRVVEIVKDEEVSFGRTLDRGIAISEREALVAIVLAIKKNHPEFLVSQEYATASGRRIDAFVQDPRSGKEWELELKRGAVFGAEGLDLSGAMIRGDVAFQLHDTYGFPIDLTRIMAEERGMAVDIAAYEKLMEEAREKARAGGKEGPSRLFDLSPDAIAKLGSIAKTDDSAKFNAAPISAKVVAIWDGNTLLDRFDATTPSPGTPGEGWGGGQSGDKRVDPPTSIGGSPHPSPPPAYRERGPEGVSIVLDRTNFYAEMGGQVGDTGELRSAGGAVMAVQTARSAGGYVLHVGSLESGHLSVGDHVTATLAGARPRTERNHTATHLANWALREVLGDGVQQKGSLVDPEKLRFDFSHGKSLGEEELGRIEDLVAQSVEKKLPVYAEEAPQEQALKIEGLRAVFGEKYPPMVRVVSIGAPVKDLLQNPADKGWRQFSVEFCGGTHIGNTGDIGAFVVTAEESVSKGIRRIVALTGDAAKEATSHATALDTLIADAGKKPEAELAAGIAAIQKAVGAGTLGLRAKRRGQTAVAALQAKLKQWEKANKSQSAGTGGAGDVSALAESLLASAVPLGPGKLIVADLPGASNDTLLAAYDSLKKRAGSYAILLASTEAGDSPRVNLLAAVSDDLIAKGLKAGDWIRDVAKAVGGGGGGRPQMAQAGGKDPSKLPAALEAARAAAAKAVG